MKKIKIDFCDFWGGFDKTDNYFYNLLKEDYEVEISRNPDVLFFSLFGRSNTLYSCKKVFYTGENIPAPLKGLANNFFPKRKFCNFVVSNSGCQHRNDFFAKLSKYKKVDSGGRFANNIGYPVQDKRKFQSEYKFSIAFENNAYRPQHPGYTTEKIMEPMTVNSMPIYWGNPLIGREFNTESFISCYDFAGDDDLIDYIIELDKDDNKYLEKMNKPWLEAYNIPETNRIESIKSFLKKIIES